MGADECGAGRLWISKSALDQCNRDGVSVMHGLSGWCRPLPLLRNLGVRTRSEIDVEKFALKSLRGDFEQMSLASQLGKMTPDLIAQVMREGEKGGVVWIAKIALKTTKVCADYRGYSSTSLNRR